MSHFAVDILGSGSSGNCVVVDDTLMLDCGLGWNQIRHALMHVKAVFVTHRHGDHISAPAVRGLVRNRPALLAKRFYTNEDTREHIERSFGKDVAATLSPATVYSNGTPITVAGYTATPFECVHDVPCSGFVIERMKDGQRLIYATDTSTLIHAPHSVYDTILIEGNWDNDQVEDALRSPDSVVVSRALRNLRHLSVQDFDAFVRTHSTPSTEVYQLHESEMFGVTSRYASI